MLDEAGRGKDLRIFTLGDLRDAPILVEEDRARTGRSLIERHDVASHAGLPLSSPFPPVSAFQA
jgi:hypothetical protein